MAQARVLVVEDDASSRVALHALLDEKGFSVGEAIDGEDALTQLGAFDPDVVLTDVRMPRLDGIGLLRRAREAGCGAAFVMMTGFGTVESVVEAMRAGAETVLQKPLRAEGMLKVLARALSDRNGRTAPAPSNLGLVGTSASIESLRETIRRAAPTPATVLILGESGTGKELVAQALHDHSPRRRLPFIKVSCSALPEGLLESELFGHVKGAFTGATSNRQGLLEAAQEGTLLLDEIGDVSPQLQLRLLRVLQERTVKPVGSTVEVPFQARILAATHRNLETKMAAGHFRSDLYYRLRVISVKLPPLRERMEDLPALAEHLLLRYRTLYRKPLRGLHPDALERLMRHAWPGNVRELENVIERGVVFAERNLLTCRDLPADLGGRRAQPEGGLCVAGRSLHDIEREAILKALDLAEGSTRRAAEMLGISPRKIQYRLKEYAQGKPASTSEA